ncbi:hypothetical protein GCM10022225_41050 [Plantactinospora mayteni]|uniref:Uncharacterized protein n=1 Tax=Plantactinospora mayteni TaxID=566021 RepID=A0ABQ4ETZ3_9ACTN|nr:hypothetical protein [Plantactinospora mayteni]GIG98129.1 hypothetical protein Pma05_47020 [Plantactinospora mayteni]
MTIGSENLGNGSAKPERFGGKYRGARRDTSTTVEDVPVDTDLGPSEGVPAERVAELGAGLTSASPPERTPTLPSLDMGGLTEPVFPPAGWPDVPTEPLVDHPLLRGLLLELPPKGSVPGSLWLDRWFEAARAILELLYVQDASRTR